MSIPSRLAVSAMVRRSHQIITSQQVKSGAYPACENFTAYKGYSWFRDGAFIADAMSRIGDVGSASRFHDWCDRVLVSRSDQVYHAIEQTKAGRVPVGAEMLPARFAFDGSVGTDPWWNFQLDGYGTWLWAVHLHAARHSIDIAQWQSGIRVACDYLCQFWNTACFDWWEEHNEHRHGSTLGAIYAGLTAVATSGSDGDVGLVGSSADRASAGSVRRDFTRAACQEENLDSLRRRAADHAARVRATLLSEGIAPGSDPSGDRESRFADGHLTKWMGTTVIDASLAACVVPFGVVDPGSPVAEATLQAIERDLTVDSGVHRFTDDVFFGGGQWPLLSCFLGWNHAVAGRTDRAMKLLGWAIAQADGDGQVPEQVDTHLLHPEREAEWVERWGVVASPLLWSHAMIITLACELGLVGREGAQ